MRKGFTQSSPKQRRVRKKRKINILYEVDLITIEIRSSHREGSIYYTFRNHFTEV